MSTSAITATSSTAPTATAANARVPKQTLGQEDFLKLLVTQMSQQDPMSPQKDTEFIAQMAQFSSLEQSKTMMQDMASLRASALLGTTVTVQDDLSPTGMNTGVVDSVVMNNGTPQLQINGNYFDLGTVLTIAPTLLANSGANNATAASPTVP